MWRQEYCEGCPMHCRYGDFTILGDEGLQLPVRRRQTHTDNLAFDLRHVPRQLFAAVRQLLWKDSSDPLQWRYRRRRTILGLLHQMKRGLWESMTLSCPTYGMGEEALAVYNVRIAKDGRRIWPTRKKRAVSPAADEGRRTVGGIAC